MRPDVGPLPALWISVQPPQCSACLWPASHCPSGSFYHPTSSLLLAVASSWPNHSWAGKTPCHLPPTWSLLIPTSGPATPQPSWLQAYPLWTGALHTWPRSSPNALQMRLSTLLWAHGLNHQAPMPSVTCWLWPVGDPGRRAGGRGAGVWSGHSLPLCSHSAWHVALSTQLSLSLSPAARNYSLSPPSGPGL